MNTHRSLGTAARRAAWALVTISPVAMLTWMLAVSSLVYGADTSRFWAVGVAICCAVNSRLIQAKGLSLATAERRDQSPAMLLRWTSGAVPASARTALSISA